MKLYISDLSVWILIIFYLPLVIWLWWKILKMQTTVAKKVVFSFLFLIVAYAIPLGDVTRNSIAMAKACPTAGLKVYKTVEVDGYIGKGSEVTLRESPYQFVESPQGIVGSGFYWNRYEKQLDNMISHSRLEHPMAEYEVLQPGGYAKFNGFSLAGYDKKTRTRKSRWIIRNRTTDEVLAEWLFISGLSGWVDRLFLYSWAGTGGSVLSCTHGSDFSVWPGSILLPKQTKNKQ